ncbi:hypothetical protein D3C76_1614460 [compost metagenome]
MGTPAIPLFLRMKLAMCLSPSTGWSMTPLLVFCASLAQLHRPVLIGHWPQPLKLVSTPYSLPSASLTKTGAVSRVHRSLICVCRKVIGNVLIAGRSAGLRTLPI